VAQVFIGIGSSINRQENIEQGIHLLRQHFQGIMFSSVFESEAVGFSGGNFYNLVAEFNSELLVEDVISILKKIEIQLGRPEKTIKFAPRTLDLDLLLYDQVIDPERDIPRAEIVKNAFVLQPLAELAPNVLHPILRVSYQALWSQYPANKQKLWKIALPIFEQ
jgi:2-amino-4-hydroxy-6-hydroxymethyldihydropteridine diphosphokinase